MTRFRFSATSSPYNRCLLKAEYLSWPAIVQIGFFRRMWKPLGGRLFDIFLYSTRELP